MKEREKLLKEIEELKHKIKVLEEERESLVKYIGEETLVFSNFIDTLPLHVGGVGKDGRFFLWNRASVEMFGYSKEEVIGKLFFKDIYFNSHEAERVMDTVENRGFFQGEVILKKKNGDTFPAYLVATKQVDGEGDFVGIFEISLDITSRKKLEQSLKESEEKFKILANTTSSAIFLYRDKFLYVNPATEELTEFTREELLNMTIGEVVHPDFRDLVLERARRRLKGEAVPRRYEFKILTKSGKEKWIDFTADVIMYEGIPTGIGTAYDITESKKNELLLKKQLSRTKKLRKVIEKLNRAEDFNELFNIIREETKNLPGHIKLIISLFNPGGELKTCLNVGVSESLVKNLEKIFFWEKDDTKALPIFINDVSTWGIGKTLPQILIREGIKSCAFIPLVGEKRLIGQIVGLYKSSYIFTEESKNVARIMADNVSSVFRRIMERKRVEEHQEMLKTLINAVPDIIYFKDGEGNLIEMNEAAENVYNLRGLDYKGKTMEEIIDMIPFHKDELLKCMEKDEKVWAKRSLYREVDTITLKGGEKKIYDLIKVPVFSREGKRRGLISIGRDITEFKRIEEELRDSEERYRAFIENSSEGIWCFEGDKPIPIDIPEDQQIELIYKFGYLRECNDAMARMYGFDSAREIVGIKLKEILPPSDPANVEYLRNFIRSGYHLTDAESHEIDRYGNEKYFLNNLTGIIKDGKLIRAWGTQRDITALKKAEMSLKQSEEKYRAVVEQSAENIFLVDIKTRKVIEANPNLQKLLGYSKEEMENLTVYDFVAHDREDVDRKIEAILKKGLLFLGERKYRKKNGELIDVEVNVSVISYGGKKVMCVVSRDITERKKAEEKIFAEKERLRTTLMSIGDGVIVTDEKGKVILINHVAQRLTGWAEEDAMGRPLEDVFRIIDEKTGEKYRDSFERVMKREKKVRLDKDILLISRNGERRIVSVAGSPVKDKYRRVIGAVIVFRDITQEKKHEEERLRLSKLESLGILAGGIAHDFNNILMGILGNISLAKLDIPQDSPAFQRLSDAEISCLNAKNLTNQLLTFAKGGAPVKEPASIKELIEESASFSLRGTSVELVTRIPESLWTVEVDPSQMNQVIQNLVINAVQAMPQGGKVFIEAENVFVKEGDMLPLPPGRYVKISVRDQGIGIPENLLPRIFDPYFTTKQSGSGLGLAICHSIIRQHGGHITVESELNKGTTFHIYIPASKKEYTGMKDEEIKEIPGHGRILLMDDEKVVREVTKAMLEKLGYEVTLAETGEEAIKLYKEKKEGGESFDVVILDLTVSGGIGGREAGKRILEYDPEAKIIISSGYFNDPVMAHYKQYGFKGSVPKPYDIVKLSNVIYKVIRGME